MRRTLELGKYADKTLKGTLYTKGQHYKIYLADEPIGWIIPGLGTRCTAYDNKGQPLGEFQNAKSAAEAVAENHVYYK